MKDQIKWVCIYKTSSTFEAQAVHGNIESAGIPCVVINKQGSSVFTFGTVEVHVPEDRKSEAELILKDYPMINPN